MSRRYITIGGALTLVAALGVAGAAQQPRITNGQVTSRPAATLQQTFTSLAGAQGEVAWIAYAVPARGNHTSCCWDGSGACRMEPSDGKRRAVDGTTRSTGPVMLEGATRVTVLFRVVDRAVERIRAYSEDCELDAGGRQIHWLENVRPADSVALLETFVTADGGRKNRLSSSALGAISMHADAAAAAAIERLARQHPTASVRSDAIFWLSQLAGAKVAGTITEAIASDPDTDVKKRAVFALSQLPRDEGVPLLIDVARRNPNPAVKKQAIFWLGQSKDPRAIDFFAQILK